MMRDEKDRQLNAPFLLFSVPVDGRDKPFRAQALSMADSAVWCPLAVEFQSALQGLTTRADRYAALGDVMAQGIDALKAYPKIENGDRVNWDALTFEQVLAAIESLFEINDPFTQAQSRQGAKIAAMGQQLEMLQKAGVDTSKFTQRLTPSE